MSDSNNNLVAGEGQSSIREFYRGKSVFITGATGFAGKSLVQRMLQTCDVKTVYILLRGKRGQNFADRLKSYLDDECFSYMNDKEQLLSKVIAFEGDITLPRLGLSDSDYATLAENVSLVFHAAASVRFTEPLRQATKLHIFGTQQVIELCRKMVNFISLTHLSSISAWFTQHKLEERVYSSPIDPKQLMTDMETMSDEEVERVTKENIGEFPKYPNSYMFTKTLCEVLLDEYAKDLKVACVRLPFILAAMKEPTPGWVDSLQTTNAMLCAYATGTLRNVYIEPEAKLDVLPVDVCSNALIATSWETSVNSENLRVYNVTLKEKEGLSLVDSMKVAHSLGNRYPSSRQAMFPADIFSKKPTRFEYLMGKLRTILIAHIIDIFFMLSGRKRFFAKLVNRIHTGAEEVTYKLHKTIIESDVNNFRKLINRSGPLSQAERNIFYADVSDINFRQVYTDLYMKFRRGVLKESDANVSEAVARLNRLSTYYRNFKYGLLVTAGAILISFVL